MTALYAISKYELIGQDSEDRTSQQSTIRGCWIVYGTGFAEFFISQFGKFDVAKADMAFRVFQHIEILKNKNLRFCFKDFRADDA